MSPRDRKRDRVLKRRRATKKRGQDEGVNDEDAFLEVVSYYADAEQTFQKSKSIPPEESSVLSTITDTVDCHESNDLDRDVSRQDGKPQKNHHPALPVTVHQTTTSNVTNVTAAPPRNTSKRSSLTKEERQRIKNQERKALRKAKKAKKEAIQQQVLHNQIQMQWESEQRWVQQQKDQKRNNNNNNNNKTL
jgi:hypothetical protein